MAEACAIRNGDAVSNLRDSSNLVTDGHLWWTSLRQYDGLLICGGLTIR